MKTKILIIVFARMILSISNPAVAQHTSSDSLPGTQKSDPPITISWHYPSIFETDARRMMEESVLYDVLPADSANYRMPMKLEDSPEKDHCAGVKPDISSTCFRDYEFIYKPVTIQ